MGSAAAAPLGAVTLVCLQLLLAGLEEGSAATPLEAMTQVRLLLAAWRQCEWALPPPPGEPSSRYTHNWWL